MCFVYCDRIDEERCDRIDFANRKGKGAEFTTWEQCGHCQTEFQFTVDLILTGPDKNIITPTEPIVCPECGVEYHFCVTEQGWKPGRTTGAIVTIYEKRDKRHHRTVRDLFLRLVPQEAKVPQETKK